jgi:uncharacterized protein (DUF885 family)
MTDVTETDRIANDWASIRAHQNPTIAIKLGMPVTGFADYSPEGVASLIREAHTILARLSMAAPMHLTDRVTRRELEREIGQLFAEHDAGLLTGELNIIASAPQEIRNSFDLLPRDHESDWHRISTQLQAVPEALAGYRRSVYARAISPTAYSRRQIEAVAAQALRATANFLPLADDPRLPLTLQADVRAHALQASASFEDFANFLTTEISPLSHSNDAVGGERYEISLRRFLGAHVDVQESYEWGLELLADLTEQQQELAVQICGEPSVPAATAYLNQDDTRIIHGRDALRRWLQMVSDESIDRLAVTHFDLAPKLRRLECQLAPAQDGGIYYTEPSLDGQRPGTMWWSIPPDVTTFHTWRERTTVYHEGVPGHHLQMGAAALNPNLNLWRRALAGTSGHREGWALYAEQLMQEFGFLDDPADQFGMLDAQKMRAARVVLDIGLHTERPRPDGGGRWTAEYALQFMQTHTSMNETSLRYEVVRYLGWPGQAASYSIGQRIWQQARVSAVEHGSIALRTFHQQALQLGGLGLDTFRWALDPLIQKAHQ